MKKSFIFILTVSLLCISVLAGCSDAQSTAGSEESSQSSESQLVNTQAFTSNETSNAADYDVVLALKTEDYLNTSIKDFNSKVQSTIDNDDSFLGAYSDLLGSIEESDSNYSFVSETLSYCIDEFLSSQMNEHNTISDYVKKVDGAYSDEDGEEYYEFMFTVLFSVEYCISDETDITVQERDALLNQYKSDLQAIISEANNEDLLSKDIKTELQEKADNLAKELSTDTLAFENAEIQSSSMEIRNIKNKNYIEQGKELMSVNTSNGS